MEQWLRIPGTHYEASDKGNIRNADTMQILKAQDNGRGYLVVKINGKTKRVHRLIMETWKACPNMNELDVDHIDYDKHNNALSNLRWLEKDVSARRQRRSKSSVV